MGEGVKKEVVVATLAVMFLTGTAYGSGYRITEQSIDSTAESGAHVAYTPGADSAYLNPANMGWLEDRGYLEANLEWIYLKSITYTDNRGGWHGGSSEVENFLLPTLFAVSPEYNKWRVGFYLTHPGGLSKKWMQPYPRTFAEEFSLKVHEGTFSLSYKFNEMVSAGGGLRGIYSSARVKSKGLVAPRVTASRYMKGDDLRWGYNLGLSIRPVEKVNLAVTYRSKVDLDFEGDAILWTSAGPAGYEGAGAVSVPLPAILALAASYEFFDQLTVELVYERNFWSEYERLDFNYPVPLNSPVLINVFDLPKAKNWQDSDSYRLGLTWDLKNSLILMAGFAYDETPVPDTTMGFDLPGSDALIYSLGFRYKLTKQMDFGASYLYVDKDDRQVVNSVLNGGFTGSGAHVVNIGISYKM